MDVVVITGGNRGIGLELCRQLAARGETVVAVVRKSSSALEEVGIEVIEGVDVTDAAAATRIANHLKERKIKLLINNAGVMANTTLEAMDAQAVRHQFEVNALAPLQLTIGLLPKFANPAKVGLITSRMGSIADNTSGSVYGYRMSKAALNAAGKSLAHDLAPKGVAVAILHPGWVKTEMTGHTGLVGPQESARLLLERIDNLDATNSGTFWHANGEILPW